ncbi:MAG: 5-formyltetrahydrofolate cyclo-ligase [Candidatus Helarchaeota archaeon]|nr:5-formyltetrahydrofolate cyclo-ligase [Candidatus Helarchaeota archaeon]
MKLETKQQIREQIWDKMAEDEIAQFPLPCFGRIPNFLGSEEASKMILKLPEFRKARFIFSAPDYVLHRVRELILQNRKDLLVATPHITEFIILRNIPPRMVRKAVTIKGMYKFGAQIRLNQIASPLDIFCQGSVAIDRKGNRLGKGKGYGDREFHLLKQEGVIDDQTLVITVVHDMQVLDNFMELMEPQDVKVQIALTPTEIIRL